MSNPSQNIGANELSSLLLGTNANGALPTTANSKTPLSSLNKKSISSQATRSYHAGNNDDDMSSMDAAQASLLLKQKHGVGKSAGGGGGMKRHYRLQNVKGKDKNGGIVLRDYHKGIQEFEMELNRKKILETKREMEEEEEQEGEEEDDDGEGVFQLKNQKKKKGKNKDKQYLQMNKQKKDEGDNDEINQRNSQTCSSRRHGSYDESGSSSDSDSNNDSRRANRRRQQRRRSRRDDSDSSSSSDSNSDTSTLRRRRRRTTRRSTDSESSSSSESDDDIVSARRNRARKAMIEKRRLQQRNESNKDEDDESKVCIDLSKEKGGHKSEDKSTDGEINNKIVSQKLQRQKLNEISETIPTQIRRKSEEGSDSDDNSSSDSSSSSASSSSSSDSEEEEMTIPSIKPMFVPKSRRNKTALQIKQQKDQDEIYEREERQKEKRIQSSRALVAEVVASEKAKNENNMFNCGDQNEFHESGGSTIPPPNDVDPKNEKDQMEARDLWEVRELLRLLRDYEEYITAEDEVKETERRRAMTDQERYEEDVKSGKYRRPGENRRKKNDNTDDDGVYTQRYYHKGAFYMDEDTLKEDQTDVRHRAAEYASARTGQDKINRKAMPEIMKVKKFGFANQGKYQGLSKEDTTDKRINYLPVNPSKKRRRDI